MNYPWSYDNAEVPAIDQLNCEWKEYETAICCLLEYKSRAYTKNKKNGQFVPIPNGYIVDLENNI